MSGAERASAFQRRDLQLIALTFAFSAAAYARIALSPLQETVRAALGLSDGQMALLQGPALALPTVALAIPFGFLIDRGSRVRLLLLLAVLDVVGSALTAFASGFTLLAVGRGLVGLTTFANNPVAISLISDLYAPAQRGRALTVLGLGNIGGNAAAFALGGVLLALAQSGQHDWRWAMLWLTSPLVLVVFVVSMMQEPSRTSVVIQRPSVHQAFRELWLYRSLVLALLAIVAMAEIALGATMVWAAPALSRTFALSPDRVAGAMAVALLVSGVLGPVAGGVSADLCQRSGGPRRTMMVLTILAFVGVPIGLFAVAPSFLLAIVLLTAFITLATAMVTMQTALFTIVVPNELRGLCMGIVVATCVLVGTGLAPMTVSALSTSTGGPATIGKALSIVCVTTGLLGALIAVSTIRLFPTALKFAD